MAMAPSPSTTPDAFDSASTILDNVTEDPATVTAAKDATAAFIADGTAPVATGLVGALNTLQEANDAKAAFLDEQDASEQDIADAVTAADNALVAEGVYGALDSDAVKAAKVSDAQTALQTALEAAQDDLADAETAVAEVSELPSAIDLFNSRGETLEAAQADLTAANAAQAGAKGSFESLNSIPPIAIATDGTVAGLIVLDDGDLVLDAGITEETDPGVTSLLSAIQTRVAADDAVTAAETSVEDAVVSIGYLDFVTGAKNAIGAEFATPVAPGDDSDALSQADVQAELNTLRGNAASTLNSGEELTFDPDGLIEVPAGGDPFGEGVDTLSQEAVDFNSLKTEVNAFEAAVTDVDLNGDFTFATAPLTSDQIDAQDAVEAAETDVEDLAELLSDLSEAQAAADELEALNDDIDTAVAAFEDLGVEEDRMSFSSGARMTVQPVF